MTRRGEGWAFQAEHFPRNSVMNNISTTKVDFRLPNFVIYCPNFVAKMPFTVELQWLEQAGAMKISLSER